MHRDRRREEMGIDLGRPVDTRGRRPGGGRRRGRVSRPPPRAAHPDRADLAESSQQVLAGPPLHDDQGQGVPPPVRREHCPQRVHIRRVRRLPWLRKGQEGRVTWKTAWGNKENAHSSVPESAVAAKTTETERGRSKLGRKCLATSVCPLRGRPGPVLSCGERSL